MSAVPSVGWAKCLDFKCADLLFFSYLFSQLLMFSAATCLFLGPQCHKLMIIIENTNWDEITGLIYS
jgi:hypothetical protein